MIHRAVGPVAEDCRRSAGVIRLVVKIPKRQRISGRGNQGELVSALVEIIEADEDFQISDRDGL